MNEFRVVVSERALLDLREIAADDERWGADRQIAYAAELARACQELSRAPRRHMAISRNPAEIRRVLVKAHHIYFSLDAATRRVVILTVRHARRRPPRVL